MVVEDSLNEGIFVSFAVRFIYCLVIPIYFDF